MTKGFRADLVPGTPVPSYFMAIMKTSTIFAVCGITCGLLSAMLGFAGKPWQAGLFGLAAGIWCIATLIMDSGEIQLHLTPTEKSSMFSMMPSIYCSRSSFSPLPNILNMPANMHDTTPIAKINQLP